MLNKLALTGIKKRWKDYLVLFSGLLIAAAIFYMFQALALNQRFLKSNSPVAVTPIVFQMGTIFLVLITIVYVLYANNFLMSMRQQEYGMFLMLGAKERTLRRLVMTETLVIGLSSTAVGVILGLGLTQLIAPALAHQLQTSLVGFHVFYWPAVLSTVLILSIIFLFAAFKNSWTISHRPLLNLLKDSAPKAGSKMRVGFVQVGQLVMSLVLLAIGYWSMTQVQQMQLLAVGLALVTVSLGTYGVINTLFRFLIQLLRRRKFAQRDLHSFTLGQLNFRIADYTKILTIVTLLFSLALGALSVGVGFAQSVQKTTDRSEYYDVTVNNPNRREQKLLTQLKAAKKTVYQYKVQHQTVYFAQEQMHRQPFHYLLTNQEQVATITPTIQQMQRRESQTGDHLQLMLIPQALDHQRQWVDSAAFQQISAPTNQIILVKTADFYQNISVIKSLVQEQQARYPTLKIRGTTPKVSTYQMINELFSGLEFMGFFLGFAFLAMLASCLMFKVLSSANSDRLRYQMLQKIGARTSLLKRSLRQELGVLFGIPAVMGIVNMLFGLQLFTSLISQPYQRVWLPIVVFLVLYFFYYVLTISLYQLIVLKRR
ncbi:ABC transporter permease [Bombilactobacillus folatiphilus]|uniref:ABC transporter permease n=1 Tax=Bombilactobacillus folatiphilus TaxID=2923362 RepID=A0ABY4P9A0_9LACO|nr:ABC transporter permease [Bombilactobacillus folatiphilus]UQS82247.1 ABC transporter permease [Bombilactobacillus folatiphilus]